VNNAFPLRPAATLGQTSKRFCLPRCQSAIRLALAAILVSFGVAPVRAQNAGKAPETWSAPARASRKNNPIPADQKSIAQGKEYFAAACLPCHGPSGRGDGPAAATLERNGVRIRPGNLSDPKMWSQTDGALFWKISEGNSPMPAFQETYSEQQRWHIINYLRTLAPSPLSPTPITQK